MSNPKLSDFNFDIAAPRSYEISLKDGRAIKTDGTEADHIRAMEMLAAIDRIGPIAPEDRPLRSATTIPLSQAAAIWLDERKKKNAKRTVDAKRFHMADFQRYIGNDPDVNTLSKPIVVA